MFFLAAKFDAEALNENVHQETSWYHCDGRTFHSHVCMEHFSFLFSQVGTCNIAEISVYLYHRYYGRSHVIKVIISLLNFLWIQYHSATFYIVPQ